MRHEKALRLLDELDAEEAPGFFLGLHLARCPSCARQARLIDAAIRAYRVEPERTERTRESGEALETRIMATVRLTPPPRLDFAVRDWLFPAAAMLLSICLVSVAADRGYIESLLGSGSALCLSLVLGLAFTGYSALFIGSHLGELRSFLQKRGMMSRLGRP
jgi:hypothetical protein